MTAVVPELLEATEKCPLSRPYADFDANMTVIPDGVHVLTLLATDAGWDWLEGHLPELAEGIALLCDAARAVGPELWMTATFVSSGIRWSLMTRGGVTGNVVAAAILEVSAEVPPGSMGTSAASINRHSDDFQVSQGRPDGDRHGCSV